MIISSSGLMSINVIENPSRHDCCNHPCQRIGRRNSGKGDRKYPAPQNAGEDADDREGKWTIGFLEFGCKKIPYQRRWNVWKLEWVKVIATLSMFVLLAAGCGQQKTSKDSAALRIADREAIEDTMNRANLGFELSDADLFAGAFAEDATFQLDAKGPVFGFDKMMYQGRTTSAESLRTGGEVPQNRSQDPELRSGKPKNVYPQQRRADRDPRSEDGASHFHLDGRHKDKRRHSYFRHWPLQRHDGETRRQVAHRQACPNRVGRAEHNRNSSSLRVFESSSKASLPLTPRLR